MPRKGRPSIVTYFIQEELTKKIRIGGTRDLKKRLKSLQAVTPYTITLLGWIPRDVKRQLHKKFNLFRSNGEWFNPNDTLLQFIKEHSIGEERILIEHGVAEMVNQRAVMEQQKKREEKGKRQKEGKVFPWMDGGNLLHDALINTIYEMRKERKKKCEKKH